MFYRLTDNDKYEADWDDDVDLAQIICPINSGHQRAGERITDLSLVLPHKPVPDVLWSIDYVIQGRVLRLFREAGFTGFDVRPVKARFERSSDNPPVLWELCVTGSAGMAHPESGIRLIERCPGCGLLVYSGCSNRERLIDVSQWDGSDFFQVRPLGYIFVTDRVADLIRDTQISGVTLQAPSELPLRPDDTY